MKEIWETIKKNFREDPVGSTTDMFLFIIIINWIIYIIGAMLF